MSSEPLFDERDRETFRLAVETWGSDAQSDMAVEELAEAIQELAGAIVTLQHLKRERAHWNDVHEELADIRIMYEQLRWFFGPEYVDERVQKKMARLRERLEDAGVDVPDQELVTDGGTSASVKGRPEGAVDCESCGATIDRRFGTSDTFATVAYHDPALDPPGRRMWFCENCTPDPVVNAI